METSSGDLEQSNSPKEIKYYANTLFVIYYDKYVCLKIRYNLIFKCHEKL